MGAVMALLHVSESAGFVRLGHPHALSNLSRDVKSSSPETTSTLGAWFLVVPELILKGRFRAIPLRNTEWHG
jgi:hypothetical protein